MAELFRSNNPVLKEKAFAGPIAAGETMTIQGTVNKTGLLLKHFEIKKPQVSFYEHNEAQSGERVMERLRAGESFSHSGICSSVDDRRCAWRIRSRSGDGVQEHMVADHRAHLCAARRAFSWRHFRRV